MAGRISRRLRRSSISRLRCMVTRASGSAADARMPTIAGDDGDFDERVAGCPLLFALCPVSVSQTHVFIVRQPSRGRTGLEWLRPSGLASTPLIGQLRRASADRVELQRRQQPRAGGADFVARPDKREIDAAGGGIRIRREDDVRSRSAAGSCPPAPFSCEGRPGYRSRSA